MGKVTVDVHILSIGINFRKRPIFWGAGNGIRD